MTMVQELMKNGNNIGDGECNTCSEGSLLNFSCTSYEQRLLIERLAIRSIYVLRHLCDRSLLNVLHKYASRPTTGETTITCVAIPTI
eukprot:6462289-Amphidinium_carterae.1